MQVSVALGLALVLVAAPAWPSSPREYGKKPVEQETLEWLWHKAQKLSHIRSAHGPQGYRNIAVLRLSAEQMAQKICPEQPGSCRTMAAYYDSDRRSVILRADLDPARDMVAASFLLHEFVHALQHEVQGEQGLWGTCEQLSYTERQAYAVQDAFLASEGQFFRAGNAMRYFVCNEEPLLPGRPR